MLMERLYNLSMHVDVCTGLPVVSANKCSSWLRLDCDFLHPCSNHNKPKEMNEVGMSTKNKLTL